MKNNEKLPGNRSFGALFVVVFGLLAVWQGWRGAQDWMVMWASLAAITLLTAESLTLLNRAWMALSHLLGRIVSPVVLGVMYAILIVPVGLFMKLIGRDVMHAQKLDEPDLFYPERRMREFAKREGIEAVYLAEPFADHAAERKIYLHGFANTQMGGGIGMKMDTPWQRT